MVQNELETGSVTPYLTCEPLLHTWSQNFRHLSELPGMYSTYFPGPKIFNSLSVFCNRSWNGTGNQKAEIPEECVSIEDKSFLSTQKPAIYLNVSL